MPGVVDVRFAEREPAEKRSLLSWEQVKKIHLTEKSNFGLCTVVTCVINQLYFSPEKHLYFARGPARFLSDY